LWLHSLKVAQLLRSAACLHTNQSRSYLNHLVYTHTHICTHIQGAGWSGDRIPVGARFFAPVEICPGVHTASYTKDTGSFLGVKRPGRGGDHSLHLASKLKKE